jgi:hypothetical protein
LSKAVKVIAETGRERNALQAEVAAARAEVARLGGEFNDAIEERDTWWNNARGLLHDYEQSRAEVARLAERLRIATQALEYLSHGAETGKTARHLRSRPRAGATHSHWASVWWVTQPSLIVRLDSCAGAASCRTRAQKETRAFPASRRTDLRSLL